MENANKKGSTKQLSMSILLVIVSVLVALTSTLAWFSMNISVKVDGIGFEVTTGDGIYVATKKWISREIITIRTPLERRQAYKKSQTSGEDIYYYLEQEEERAVNANYITIENGTYHVYLLQTGQQRTAVETIFVDKEQGDYVYLTDTQDAGSAINTGDYAHKEATGNANEYLLKGNFLVEPEAEDYRTVITEEELARVCMNNPDAKKITDAMLEATTMKDSGNNALSVIDLVSKDGGVFPMAAGAKGNRFLVDNSGSQAAVYKLQFELYFRSLTDYRLVLNTFTSSITSEKPKPTSERPVVRDRRITAWKDLETAKLSTDAAILAHYGDIIPTGRLVESHAQNAVRFGFSSADHSPIGIWDPNPNKGWNINDSSGNLGLQYYNYTNGQELTGTPANASVTSDTALFTDMEYNNGFYERMIIVTFWLEGFDGDCFDGIMDDILNIRLDFAGQQPD